MLAPSSTLTAMDFNTDTVDAVLADLLRRLSNPELIAEKYADMLRAVIVRPPQLSPFNAFLVEQQRPGASPMLRLSEWQEYGRQPKPNVPAVLILQPFAPVIPVYEFRDTEPIPYFDGEVLEQPPSFTAVTAGDVDAVDIVRTLVDRACHIGADVHAVHVGDRLGGDVRRENRGTRVIKRTHVEHHFRLIFYVRYQSQAEPAVQCATLVHEFAHILLGHLGPMNDAPGAPQRWSPEQRERLFLSKEIKELEAETVAYLVCSRLGIRPNSPEYLAGYVGDMIAASGTWPAQMSITKVLETTHAIEELLGDYARIRRRAAIRTSERLA